MAVLLLQALSIVLVKSLAFWENIKNRNNIFKNAKKFTTTIQKPMIEIILRICLAYQEM